MRNYGYAGARQLVWDRVDGPTNPTTRGEANQVAASMLTTRETHRHCHYIMAALGTDLTAASASWFDSGRRGLRGPYLMHDDCTTIFTDRLYHMEELCVTAADGMAVSLDKGHLVPFVAGMAYQERDHKLGSLSRNMHSDRMARRSASTEATSSPL